MELTETLEIEGIQYRVIDNDDPDCPISIFRIYNPGDKRTLGNRIFQTMQEDGSWLTTNTVL